MGREALGRCFVVGMSSGKSLCVAVSLMFVGVPAASAFCSSPSAPGSYRKPTSPTEPQTPYCVNKYARTHTCSDWEIDNYNRAIDRYNDELKRYREAVKEYVDDLIEYADEAEEYALCEMNSLD